MQIYFGAFCWDLGESEKTLKFEAYASKWEKKEEKEPCTSVIKYICLCVSVHYRNQSHT